MRRINKLEIGLIVVIFIILFVIIINTPLIYKYKNNSNLIINEVMSSNKTTITDTFGKYSDYIEIYNGYDYDINLKDYHLSDDNFNLKKWSFPDVTIKGKSYLIVFATGKNIYENDEIHTNFKISASGEVLTLSDEKAKPLSRIYFSNTKSDTSYGYNGKDYVYYYVATPGKENSNDYEKDAIIDKDSDILLNITEYSKNNNARIELYNPNEEDINLENYYLSNESKNPYKYTFPKVTIKGKSYLVLYADNTGKFETDKIHLNFTLEYDDNILILSDNKKNQIVSLHLQAFGSNVSCGYYNNNWYIYGDPSFGETNKDNYLEVTDNITKTVRINEVTESQIELKNLTDKDINLTNYTLTDKSEKSVSLKNITIKANSYTVINCNNVGLNINESTEKLYLYDSGHKIDEFEVGRLIDGVSSGIDESDNRVFYKNITMGRENSTSKYLGYTINPIYSQDGGYVEKGTKITLSVPDDTTIYYTLDGSFPSERSTKYTGEITINKTTVVKAIAYRKDYLPSETISRTFIVGRKHELPVVSISSENNNFFGYSGIITNYHQNTHKKINFEFYERDGRLGTSFVGDTKLSGMDSREQPQKSMSVYLRKQYGKKEVTYPFFNNYENTTYSSILLRNAGEDPKNIRIMDAVLTRTLKGQMDIDMQDYRPVVVYINGTYYGIYNLREKLNPDYIETKFNIDKDEVDFIKYTKATRGSTKEYNDIVNYINTHDPAIQSNYEYIKSKIDVEELCNYWIAESYYGNTDLGNIKYWKAKNGKWRFMLYDLDWAMWSSNVKMSYPVVGGDIPAVTYVYSTISITRRLYRNPEFKDLYLSTLAYHLKNTFKPDRMNKIVDELAKEIEPEMPYHIEKWGKSYSSLNSMNKWNNNLNSFKSMITNRYNTVLKRLRSEFNLSESEYNKYFKELK